MRMVESSRPMWRALSMALLMAISGVAGAQGAATYPNKPVRLIVAFPAGGVSDSLTRVFANNFSKDMGQNFIVDNRGGGDTVIGTSAAAKAPGDGYTLLSNSSTILINHWLRPDLNFDTLKELSPIAILGRSEVILAVHPSMPGDLKEFLAYARANPGKINASSPSTTNGLFYQIFMNATGTRLTIVPYKGGGPAMTDLVGGVIQAASTNVSNVQALIAAGKLKGVAITGNKRSPLVPGVPTYAENGVKNLESNNWFVLAAPSRTPRDIVDKMNAQVRRAQETPEVIAGMAKLGFAATPMNVTQAEGFFRAESDLFRKLVKESGIRADDY